MSGHLEALYKEVRLWYTTKEAPDATWCEEDQSTTYRSHISASGMHLLALKQFADWMGPARQDTSAVVRVVDGGSGSGIMTLMFAAGLAQTHNIDEESQVIGIEHTSKASVVRCAMAKVAEIAEKADLLQQYGFSITNMESNEYTLTHTRDDQSKCSVHVTFQLHDSITAWPEFEFGHLGFEVSEEDWPTLSKKCQESGCLIGPKKTNKNDTYWCQYRPPGPETCETRVRYQGTLPPSSEPDAPSKAKSQDA